MMSVMRTTKAPVKFWILKNYLSPTLKQFLPYYAEKYGFQYEYVQYKWPRWLNQQTEKQRIIWGYKILFLDVMFPLDVKKIIFVDTDQIVRADLTELRDMDLGGAPYGYGSIIKIEKNRSHRLFTGTLRSATRMLKWKDSGSGSRATGRITWLDESTTFPHSMWSTWSSSGKLQQGTVSGASTRPSAKTPTLCQI